MLIGTVDFFYFIPLSLTLILPGGHEVSPKQNLLASFSHNFSTEHDEIWYGIEAIEHSDTSCELGLKEQKN